MTIVVDNLPYDEVTFITFHETEESYRFVYTATNVTPLLPRPKTICSSNLSLCEKIDIERFGNAEYNM